MFGSTPTSAPGFGATATPFGQTPASSAGSSTFFAAASTPSQPFGQQPQAVGSALFGQTGAATPAVSFGAAPTTTPASSAPFANLFGQQQQPPQQPNLFGQQQQPPQQPSLFGQQQQHPQQANLFGQQQQPPQQPNLFALPAAGATPGGSYFQPSTGSTSVFNTAQKPPTQPTLGGVFASNPAAAQPPSTAQPGLPNAVDPSKIKDMRYQELPEEYRKFIDAMETHVKTQIHLANDVAVMVANNADEIRQSERRIKDLSGRVVSAERLLERDDALNDVLREDIRKSLRSGEMVMRFMDRARPPNQPVYLPTEAEAARRYFDTLANTLEAKIQTCLQALEELEQVVPSGNQAPTMSIQDMADTIQSQHEVFMGLAAQAASLHEAVNRHWEEYRQFQRTYLGSEIEGRREPSPSRKDGRITSLAASMLRPSTPSSAGRFTGESDHVPHHHQAGLNSSTMGGAQQPLQMQPFFGQGSTPVSTTKKTPRRR
ncbi:hypothetical protein SeLEV6574_g00348 [Synchytrium endobioticum]|uniref:Nucleoporin Nup54 alpha-helical domain-containing protein n=1 Tax=Synchytrium endobioticum TaxID=286115 RepID=A0A507DJH0_9FUNG|nr:hypothetical protein SeLEV6574_g00348 [Synchytrium endobioticum]